MNSNRFILDILKSFIEDQSITTIPDSINWNAFRRMTEVNSISGIVGFVLNQSSTDTIPINIISKFNDDFLSTITLTTIRDEEMKSLIEQLNSNNIDHMLFKGYIIKDLYTVPELRTFGDIDFAIRFEDRKKCNELMVQNGYRLLDDWEPVYSYKKGDEHYEIHTELLDSNLNNNYDYRSYFSAFWKHGTCMNQHTFLLDLEFHLLFLLMHIAKHIYSSGAGIRMYLDIAFYLQRYREEIDWIHFHAEIKSLKLTEFANTVFSAVENWFNIKSPIPLERVDSQFMEEFLTFTLNGGVFGYNGDSAKLSQVRKNSHGKTVKKTSTLLKKAFPSVSTIKSRYTYLDRKPWLLPVAWVHRFVIKKGTALDYIEESKRIMLVNKKEVIKLNEFYRAIGL